MLKYSEIINRMSDGEKIRLLCDITCLSEKRFRVLGIPELDVCEPDELGGQKYPHAEALANTWNTELIGRVASEQIKRASKAGKGFIKIPSPRVKINPYRVALSEDPWLASRISHQYLQAAQDAEVAASLVGYGIYRDELEWLDKAACQRFLYTFIREPYAETVNGLKCAALLTEPDLSANGYCSVNTELASEVSQDKVASGAFAIYTHVSAENTVLHLARGGLFFRGSALALESAHARYKKLVGDIKHGNATTEELNCEITEGKAISTQTIDTAVDKLLDFIYTVKGKPNIAPHEDTDDLARIATEESLVLLKNQDGLLPLKCGHIIGYIGDIAYGQSASHNSLIYEVSELLRSEGYTESGFARGYDATLERNSGLVDDAVLLANSSDIVIVFLGMSDAAAHNAHKTKQLAIPANQQELLDRLAETKAKIIAVLPSGMTLDIGDPQSCHSIIAMPQNTLYSARVLVDAVTGKINPSGRLANSMYCDTDKLYVEYKTRRERDDMKVGNFIGYRYYTTSGLMPLFAFGHGLGYAKITYSSVSVVGDTVRFELKNHSKIAAMEIAQIYIGKTESAVVRPHMELAGFAKVKLEPGEQKTVEIPIRIPNVYSVKQGKAIKESGIYTVYVGASCADIRLTHNFLVHGEELEKDGERMSDYVHSITNIFTDNYKLEAKIKAMKRSVFNIVAGGLALALAIVLKLFCFANELYYDFFDWFAIALGVTGISFFIAEAIRRSYIRGQEQNTIDALNKEAFNGAEQVPVYSADKMFVKEFDSVEENVEKETAEHIEGVEAEYMQYIDKDISLELAARELEEFAAQRGCKFRADVTKKILASLACSRLVVTEGMDNDEFKRFVHILCEYFEVAMFIDTADASYISAEKILFKTDAQGNKVKTNVHLAIDSARKNAKNIHLAAITDVIGADVPAYFTPFANFAKNPLADHRIVVFNERNVETSYHIPKNIWFILNLAEGETPDKLPAFITDIATVNVFDHDVCSTTEQTSQMHPFSYYQLDYLTERACNRISIDEDTWKKVDRLEEYVNGFVPFHIGNKLWLCIERFAHVFVACGGDELTAFDEAVCAKLIVPVINAMSDKLLENEIDLCDTVESILGEDHAYACKRLSKRAQLSTSEAS